MHDFGPDDDAVGALVSGYVCIRCGDTDDEARAAGCRKGHAACPMQPVSLNARLRPYGWSVGKIAYVASMTAIFLLATALLVFL